MHMRASHDYIIFPLDVPSFKEAKEYIRTLKDSVGLFKVGLELFVSEGPKVLDEIARINPKKIFLDLKFHDIPETVARAQKVANKYGVEFITIHCSEGSKLLTASTGNADMNTKILGVTVLTSVSDDDLKESLISLEFQETGKLVLHRARLAQKAGCAGVVCSGHEVEMVKAELGSSFLVVTPGIRPKWSLVPGDDQKRIVTPGEAVSRGADYIVVGRPIRDARDPAHAAARVSEEIAEALL